MIEKCPKCNTTPRIIHVGDEGGQRRYWTVQCPQCLYEAADLDEAKLTQLGAINIWNRKVRKDNECNQ